MSRPIQILTDPSVFNEVISPSDSFVNIYSSSLVNSSNLLPLTTNLVSFVSTPAIFRIGHYHISNNNLELQNTEYEYAGVGESRIGSKTIFGSDEYINVSNFNADRHGKDVKNYDHFNNTTNLAPLLRISNLFFEDLTSDRIDNSLHLNQYGVGKEYKTLDEKNVLIPYEDFSEILPESLLGKKTITAYPFVHNVYKNFEQFLDLSDPKYVGAIDVFEVRRSLINSSVTDYQVSGIKANYPGGDIENLKRGSSLIENYFVIGLNDHKPYLDSQDIQFSDFSFASGNSGYKLQLEGYINLDKSKLDSYNDNNSYINDNYNNNSLETFIDNYFKNNVSEIGTRFKSSNCGLLFGESNPLGTDSISFGGFKK